MPHHGYHHRVLEHIGMVACVEGVAVTEHPAMVTARVPLSSLSCAKSLILRIISGSAALCGPAAESIRKENGTTFSRRMPTPPKRFPSEERRPWKRANVRGLTWGPPNQT